MVSASQVLVSFLFSERSDSSWFGGSIPSVICLFPLIISMARFPMPNSILYLDYIFYFSLQFFFVFCKLLDVVHVYLLNPFLQFSKCVTFCRFSWNAIEWYNRHYKQQWWKRISQEDTTLDFHLYKSVFLLRSISLSTSEINFSRVILSDI